FIGYFTDVERGDRGKLTHLFAGAVLLGLAGLAKYNAAYLGLAIVGAVLLRPKLRPLLTSWPLYSAGALTLVMQMPVLVWNLEHGFASFAFHTAERFEGHFTGLHIERMKAFVVDTGSLLGPFIIPAIISFFLRRQKNPFECVGKTLAGLTFILSTGTFLYIANYAWVMWWWNVAAFVLILPFLGRIIGRFMLVM